MISRTLALATIIAVGFWTAQASAQNATVSPQTSNNCAATDKVDGSTAQQAQQKLEAAGYTNITGLNKGCDNVWHAQALANGKTVNVMLAPNGVVNQETN